VNVYLDEKYAFGLNLQTLQKKRLKVGKSLTEKEIKEIVKEGEFINTLDKLLRFASIRPRSEKEINDWLGRKKVHQSIQKDLFKRLKKLQLVNDENFASWWVEQRINFRPKAIFALKYELIQKGISRDIIKKTLLKINVNEPELAKKLIEEKKYRWKNLSSLDARKKMSDFLLRKGFTWEVIKKAIE
jgi:regulatory protein